MSVIRKGETRESKSPERPRKYQDRTRKIKRRQENKERVHTRTQLESREKTAERTPFKNRFNRRDSRLS